MITTICGLPGQGKSLRAALLLASPFRGYQYTNMTISAHHPAFHRTALIGTERHPVYTDDGRGFWQYIRHPARVVVDEADIYFDCKANVNPSFNVYLKQHRHLADEVIFVVQNPMNLHVRFRRLCRDFIYCHRDDDLEMGRWGWALRFLPRRWRMFRFTSFSGPSCRPADWLRAGQMTYAEAERVFKWYDTTQLIGNHG